MKTKNGGCPQGMPFVESTLGTSCLLAKEILFDKLGLANSNG